MSGLLLGPLAAWAAPPGTSLMLRGCASQVPPATRGLGALDRLCPGLEARLKDVGATLAMTEESLRRLTPSGLIELADLVDRYAANPPGPAPDTAPVRGIVADLTPKLPANVSWWDIVKSWLASFFQEHGQTTVTWLDRWLGRFGNATGVLTVCLYGLVAAVFVAVIVFLVVELKAARRSRGVSPRRDAPPRHEAWWADSRAPRAALDAAPDADKPAVLLQLLVNTLVRAGRLSADRHLTHRELTDRSRFDDQRQRQRFAQVASLAESLLYGPAPHSLDRVGSVVADGRELLRDIERSRDPV